uniref:Uncharacterized protein n=1 Tax=Poecilia mexicana TaxID=48701 RepID=A0A3B3WUC4_9TELE
MRLKEIQRTAHQAWSPAGHHPIYLALGTSAQQLDASFNTTAAIEIFEMDFADPSLEMQCGTFALLRHPLKCWKIINGTVLLIYLSLA